MLKPQHQAWVDDARTDLQAARLLSDSGYPHLAVFEARQSVEKLLKCCYPVLLGRPMPREHSLQAMVHQVFGHIPDEKWDIIKRLNPFYMSTRYVDAAGGPPSHRFDLEDGRHALAMAEEAFRWIESQLIERA